MSEENDLSIELSNPNYVPVVKDTAISYGGSQMWFSNKKKLTKDYIINNYGCGTIAAADLFLYLAMQNDALKSPETKLALPCNDSILDHNYTSYIHRIHDKYTGTHRFLGVLGPKLASSINAYAREYNFDYNAVWKWKLNYYDMYNMIEEMLSEDIPVILSIGPNTPKLWGREGISFYEKVENTDINNLDDVTEKKQLCFYNPAYEGINSHYVTVTALIKDPVACTIMLRISSWGKQYYINYEEYRNYIENFGDTITSSIVYVNKILW